ncbi:hypothetical protein CDAR_206091 [Caerostris darwini]|uniref:Uncharacterized protein n=1 Tax=Caerostris darwini TaxID=1538125 RepID=A0AAV4VX55_9ARAC|nr:hypothetical protein CDAR_206091 [Caerostris darwini]
MGWQRKQQSGGRILGFVRAGKRASQGKKKFGRKEISTGDEATLREKEIESQVPHIGNFRMMSGNNDLTLLLFEKKKKLLDSISSGQVIPVSISCLCRDGLKFPKLQSH